MGLVVLSLFDGISCGQQALHRLDVEVDAYYASEVDTHAITLTQHNWPNTVQLGDVQRVKYIDGVLHSEHGHHRVPHIDLLIGAHRAKASRWLEHSNSSRTRAPNWY